uniref:Uncharacterized protein n=1 Tax=uncultured marine virus TaxID=186617 RepID=A0A0F7L5P3_9VIRU|nr:hypothetical protein [uncultured marine virus]
MIMPGGPEKVPFVTFVCVVFVPVFYVGADMSNPASGDNRGRFSVRPHREGVGRVIISEERRLNVINYPVILIEVRPVVGVRVNLRATTPVEAR